MWRRCGACLLLLAACAAGPVERQRLADGSWHFTCQLSMEECIRHLEIVCPDKRYRIMNAQSKREVRDVEPGTREYRVSELFAICDRDVGASSPPAPPASAAPISSAPSRPNCVPGSTQACVGPGGCAGAQACRADASAFGPCECPTKPAGGSPEGGSPTTTFGGDAGS